FYDEVWRAFLALGGKQAGTVGVADLVYLRSGVYVREQRLGGPPHDPPLPPVVWGEEGENGKANPRPGPLYPVGAAQRQLNYPEVPRARPPDDLSNKVLTLQAKFRELEMRLKLVEGELRGQVDLSEFGKPEILGGLPPDEEI